MRYLYFDKIKSIKKMEYMKGSKLASFEESQVLRLSGNSLGLLPTVVLVESINQAIFWFVAYSTEFKNIPMLVEVPNLQIHGDVRAGARLDIEVKINKVEGNSIVVDACGYCEDKKIIESLDMSFSLAMLEKYLVLSDCLQTFKNLSAGAEIM